jgi:hypothetical protein
MAVTSVTTDTSPRSIVHTLLVEKVQIVEQFRDAYLPPAPPSRQETLHRCTSRADWRLANGTKSTTWRIGVVLAS